eukprot:CAMPEP_0113540506 /NCGR_PEP_ID=MMETSP0015_2-20120614/8516_1 /TAXON_ID=2838 /ORGANISM="Odontella" /LENGTH=975 /DNA_ID=CAMNT_0000440313 /DNA_START=135 /DNA_END=3063 /DNA_ORIENTATION=+ /assembly_acc=CAM_ASM_000160
MVDSTAAAAPSVGVILLERFRILNDADDDEAAGGRGNGPALLRHTRSELSFRAVDLSLGGVGDQTIVEHENDDEGSDGDGDVPPPLPKPVVVLRFLSDRKRFLSELSVRDALGNAGYDDNFLPVLAAYQDAAASESDWGLDSSSASSASSAASFVPPTPPRSRSGRRLASVETRLDVLRDAETASSRLAKADAAAAGVPRRSASSLNLLADFVEDENASNSRSSSYPYVLVHPVSSVTSLRTCLARNPVPWDDRSLRGARRVVGDVVDGLLSLHGRGVVHRNLSTGCVVRTDESSCLGRASLAAAVGGSTSWRISDLGSCTEEDVVGGGAAAALKAAVEEPKSAIASITAGGMGKSSTPGKGAPTAAKEEGEGCEWDAFPDWGCLPPEAAAAALAAGESTEAAEGTPSSPCASPPVGGSSFEESPSQPAWDLWSLGCVLFALVFKTELWQTDRDGKISSEDRAALAGWTEADVWHRVLSAASDFGGSGKDWTDEETAAIDLIVKLLDPTPGGRFRHFELGIVSVHQHEFIEGQPLSPPSLAAFTGRRHFLTSEHGDRERYHRLTSTLDLNERWELKRALDVLLLGAFEPPAHEARVPTSFVVLRRPLPLDGRMRNPEEALWEGVRWLKAFESVAPHVRRALLDRDVRSIGRFWSAVESDGHHADDDGDGYRYFYLVDDVTGEPVLPVDADDVIGRHGAPYPIPVKDRSDVLPALLPLMHLTMRSAALRRGAAGLARLFGAGPTTISSVNAAAAAESSSGEDARVACQDWINDLKDENGKLAAGDMFGSFVEDVDRATEPRGSEERKFFFRDGRNVRSRSVEELARFLRRRGVAANPPGEEEEEEEEDFVGLVGSDRGRALWTVLGSSDAVKAAVADRAADRLEEERHLWDDRRTAHRAEELRADLVRSKEDLSNVRRRAAEETGRADMAEDMIKVLEEALENAKNELGDTRCKLEELEKNEDRARSLVATLSLFG